MRLQGGVFVWCMTVIGAKLAKVESQGMLLVAQTSDKSVMKPLRPPKGSQVGERLLWSGEDITPYKPDENMNIRKKTSVWHNISPKLQTNSNGEVCFDGKTMNTSAGVVTADLKDALIG